MANNNTKTLAQFYGVLLYKKKDIVAIQKKFSMLFLVTIGGNANKLAVPPDSELMEKTLADFNKAFTDILFGEIFNLLMYLEDDIIAIQEKLSIVSYFNQESIKEANKTIREYLQKFEDFYDPLEDGLY
ncbi:hypothetical protein C1645_824333 [Glomus cerebriforme]|uniref:Uncharacterized protein n=1 Tax=Glomus cerebriforme TaxID=658196 RepID=A0A397SVR4_9GLOM|nr:hypothetical protein C1645_824333 [Glomus cerebriforme]